MREPVSLPPSRTSAPTFAVSATPSQTHDQTSPTQEMSTLAPTPTSAPPTGKIVFEVDSGVSGIYTIRADGRELSLIHRASPNRVSKSPKWTTDGTGVVFRTSEGNDAIQMISLTIFHYHLMEIVSSMLRKEPSQMIPIGWAFTSSKFKMEKR